MKKLKAKDKIEKDLVLEYSSTKNDIAEEIWQPDTKVEVPVLDFSQSMHTAESDVDVSEEDLVLAEESEVDDIQEWLVALEKHFGQPASGAVQKNGLQPSVNIQHNYPLHYAASEGSLALMSQMLDINSRDNLDSTPLHVAVFKNHLPVVQLLVEKGADLNILAYQHFSPFTLAVVKEHWEICAYLLQQESLQVDEMAMYSLLEKLSHFTDSTTHENHMDAQLELSDRLALVENAAKKMQSTLITEDELGESIPVSIVLELFAQQTNNLAFNSQFRQVAEAVKCLDNNHQIYIDHKMLMHLFAIDGQYQIHYYDNNASEMSRTIDAEGLLGHYALDFAAKTIAQYLNDSVHEQDRAACMVFKYIQDILKNASLLNQYAHQSDWMQGVLEDFQQGKLVYVPTGWEGHFVVLLLDGTNHYLVSVNTGEAYEKNPAGSVIYHINHPDQIDLALLEKIASNEMQFDLEYDLQYALGLSPLYTLESPEQVVGNCGWRSIEVSVKTLLFLDYLKQGLSTDEAEQKADLLYQDWLGYTKVSVLSAYLENYSEADAVMLVNILQNSHPSLYDDSLPLDVYEWRTAEILIEHLSGAYSIEYLNEIGFDSQSAGEVLSALLLEHDLACAELKFPNDSFVNIDQLPEPTTKKPIYTWDAKLGDGLALSVNDIINKTAPNEPQINHQLNDYHAAVSQQLLDVTPEEIVY